MQNLLLPISITFGLLGFTLITRLYVIPWIKNVDARTAQIALIIPHTFRYIGLSFLIPGVTDAALDARFAEPAAYGDLASAVLAIIAILLLLARSRAVTLGVWTFNIVGFVDLLTALTLGLMFTPDGDLGATYFIPALIVPMLLVSHVTLFGMILPPKNRDVVVRH